MPARGTARVSHPGMKGYCLCFSSSPGWPQNGQTGEKRNQRLGDHLHIQGDLGKTGLEQRTRRIEKRQWVKGHAKNRTHRCLPVDLCGRQWKQHENASEGSRLGSQVSSATINRDFR